nr:MAG TPA: hypothetical protein [Caudoviricetes sp.]
MQKLRRESLSKYLCYSEAPEGRLCLRCVRIKLTTNRVVENRLSFIPLDVKH